MSNEERESILELLMDSSGTMGHIEDTLDLLKNINLIGFLTLN